MNVLERMSGKKSLTVNQKPSKYSSMPSACTETLKLLVQTKVYYVRVCVCIGVYVFIYDEGRRENKIYS